MNERESALAWRTLTEWELLAISGPYNVADGHARGWITEAHKDLVGRLSAIYQSSIYADQSVIERRFSEAFFKLSGQRRALSAVAPMFQYSSSVCIDIIGEYLAGANKCQVGILTPTFDNIAALLRRRGLELIPVPERIIFIEVDRLEVSGLDALFIISPNNPTGCELSGEKLEIICKQMRRGQHPADS